MCLEEWSVLLLAVTAMVAVRNTALLCMLALVTEASLPVTGENTRDAQTWMSGTECQDVLHIEGP